MTTISESGMSFGPFEKENFFYIEKSEVYRQIESQVKIVEFVWLKEIGGNSQIWLIEAKQSSPHPKNPDDWDSFLNDLKEKFNNSMCLFIALCINRHTDSGFQDSMKTIDLATIPFKLMLVIKGHKKEWLPPLKDALQQKLKPLFKSLNLGANPLVVLNDSMALEIGLIS